MTLAGAKGSLEDSALAHPTDIRLTGLTKGEDGAHLLILALRTVLLTLQPARPFGHLTLVECVDGKPHFGVIRVVLLWCRCALVRAPSLV